WVRSFTGGFTEPSMKVTPGGADTKGTTAGPTTTNGPSAEEHSSEAVSRMRPDCDWYECAPPTGTPLDGDWFT
ncbi:MAG TPA: hypothetical protein VF328_02890, partial [Mycobacterium sp.]